MSGFKPMKPRRYGDAKEVVARLFEQAGGVPKVMELIDLSRTRVYAFSDPDTESEISYARVARITEETGARAAAEHLALLAGGVFLPAGDASAGDWHSLAGEAAQRNAATIAEMLDALGEESDAANEITPREARAVLARVDRQIALLSEARARLAAIARADGEE